MTYFGSEFGGGAQSGVALMTTLSTTAGVDGFDTASDGTVSPDNTGTNIAYPTATATTSADQFAQITTTNNQGTSNGVWIRGTYLSGVGFTGYLARQSATNVLLLVFASDGTTTTTLETYTVTRAAGDKIRATAQGNILKVYLNDMTTPVITHDITSDTVKYATGSVVGFRAVGAATQPKFDSFYGGDLSDVGSVGTPANGGAGGNSTPSDESAETITTSPANGLPGWKGIVQGTSGRWIFPGKPLHKFPPVDGFGAPGTFTPAAPFSLTDGAAAYLGGAGIIGLSTTATAGAKATLALTPDIDLANYQMVRIDIEGLSFSAASPGVILRIGAVSSTDATIGGGAIQRSDWTTEAVRLYSGGEAGVNRTRAVFSHLGANATQRRQTSVFIVPSAKGAGEVFLMEDEEVLGWRRDTSFKTGLATVKIQIENIAAVAATLKFARVDVTLYS